MSRSPRFGPRTAMCAAALGLSLLCAQDGHAQTLAVDAGDHQGFTRLVIRIGADRSWQLDQDGRIWRLSLDPGVERFDLAGSFDLIQRNRIANLSQEGATLAIALACDCDVSAFRYRDSFVVVDVSDPTPTPDPGPAALRASDTVAPPPTEPRAPRPETAGEIAAAALPDLARLLTPGTTPGAPRPTPPEGDPPPVDPAPAPVEPAPANTSRPNIEEAAQIMAEQLARAAAAGLLEPQAGTPLDFADPVDARPTREASPGAVQGAAGTTRPTPPDPLTLAPAQPATSPAIDAAPEPPPRSDPPILARNAFDIATAPLPDTAPVQPRLECVGRVHPLNAFPASPEEEEPSLGALRQAVFDERDRLVEDAVLRLSQYYIERGFGAEAVYWLTRLDDPPADLVAIARMTDGLETPDFPMVSDSTACSDQELVFRYLGGAMQTPIAETEARRIQQGFTSLPDQLQRQFGPDLARRLAAEGHAGTARNLRDMLRQSRLLPEAVMLTLDLDLGVTPPMPQIDAALTQALRDDGAMPAATMSRSLARDRAEDRRPDPDRLVAAEALLRETPPGPDADLLWQEIVIGHARLGQVDAALATLAAGRARAPAVWQSAVTGLVADRLEVEDGATLLILAHLIGADWTATGTEAGRIRVAASRFLAAEGLAEAAARIMAGRPALTVPARDGNDAAGPSPTSGWAESGWSEAAETLPGAQGDIARRMAAREIPPAATADARSGTLDLDALAERVADSRALRDAANALLDGPAAPSGAGREAP